MVFSFLCGLDEKPRFLMKNLRIRFSQLLSHHYTRPDPAFCPTQTHMDDSDAARNNTLRPALQQRRAMITLD